MTIFRHLRPSDHRVMPWKNGKGSTVELAVHPPPQGKGIGDFLWRVSVATVDADGPFSSFPGYDRKIVVLEGEGMMLSHGEEGSAVRLGPLEPYSFPGEAATTCRLMGGPVRDFNVMTRRGESQSTVSVVMPDRGLELSATGAGFQLLYCHQGRCQITAPEGAVVVLEPGDVLRIEGLEQDRGVLRLTGDPACVVVRVEIEVPDRSAG